MDGLRLVPAHPPASDACVVPSAPPTPAGGVERGDDTKRASQS